MYIPQGQGFLSIFFIAVFIDVEQCRPHGRIQYLLKESMTACLKARRHHGEVAERSTLHRQARDNVLREREREMRCCRFILKAFQFPFPISNEPGFCFLSMAYSCKNSLFLICLKWACLYCNPKISKQKEQSQTRKL